jgi:hypothetical protein
VQRAHQVQNPPPATAFRASCTRVPRLLDKAQLLSPKLKWQAPVERLPVRKSQRLPHYLLYHFFTTYFTTYI